MISITSKMKYDPMHPKQMVEAYPELKPYKNLSDPFTDKIFRYVCLIYDKNSPIFNTLLPERKQQAMEMVKLVDGDYMIECNQLEEVKWAVSLFFTITNNPVIEIYVSLQEAFSNLLEKARTKPVQVDESQEKIAYEGVAKAADSAFEMYNKLKLIREEFNNEFGEFDILDLVKQGEKAKPLEEKINFAERRAQKNADEAKKKKNGHTS
jgi:hypothetical protein